MTTPSAKIALLLAAGRGERLRPLTDQLPKPLCTIHKRPLLDYHLERLSQAGFRQVIINHAHLGDQIRRYVGNGQRWGLEVNYSPEPPGALETGGGIYAILKRYAIEESFISINADIRCDYPLEKLRIPDFSLAHLVLVPNPPDNKKGDFGLSAEGYLSANNPQYTYSGIAEYSPELWRHCHTGRYSVTPLIKQAMSQSKASGEVYCGLWQDIGTLERLQQANQEALMA